MKKNIALGCVAGVLAFFVCTSVNAARGPSNVTVPNGYFVEAFSTGLDFPTAIAFGEGKVWVAEAGLSGPPVIRQINGRGVARSILSGGDLDEGMLMGPVTDVTFHAGRLWITHRALGDTGLQVGAISSFDPDDPVDTFRTVITNLPAAGDHSVEEITFSRSGRAYFSIGSATNSGVVGADNALITGWLPDATSFHDFAPVNITLNGASFETAVPFSLDPSATAVTAPYRPFGSGAVSPGTVIPAATPATPQEGIIAGNGTVYSFDPAAADPTSTMRLEAWGFRNPYGIGFDPSNPNHLYVTNNGADTRSAEIEGTLTVVESRPLEEDADDLYGLMVGGEAEFFGWPDFFHDEVTGAALPVTDATFCEQGELSFPCPGFVLTESVHEALTVQPALAQFEEHSSANKFDISTSQKFRFMGDMFVAETGSLPPATGAEDFVGFSVVRTNPVTGVVQDFIAHTSNDPDVIFEPEGLNKPIDVKFRGDVMFIVDLGVFEPGLGMVQPGTGKIWVVSHGKGALNGITSGGLSKKSGLR